MKILHRAVKALFNAAGLEIRRQSAEEPPLDRTPVEFSAAEREIIAYVRGNDLTLPSSANRVWATMLACKHAIEQDIAGDFVECGVWRGGHPLIAAAMFKLHRSPRHVYLFDTFEGMTEPTERDRETAAGNVPAIHEYEEKRRTEGAWVRVPLEEVQENFRRAGLLGSHVHFVKGDVRDTLAVPENLPQAISVLRLDTDWYDSTKRELEILYPRLTAGGTLLIDDYGHWAGARAATDEYFSAPDRVRPLLQYTDYTARAGTKR